jgi:hypothetical protein
MVLAVANNYAFEALKQVMASLRQHGAPSIINVFSNEPRILVHTVTAFETASELYSYMRRFALARLAKLYRNTVENQGQLATDNDDACLCRRRQTNKADKAKAYCAMIEHIWGVTFPAGFKGKTMTRSGLINSEEHDAVRWNECKRKLSKMIEAGNRWSSLGLISRDWAIRDHRVVVTDRM